MYYVIIFVYGVRCENLDYFYPMFLIAGNNPTYIDAHNLKDIVHGNPTPETARLNRPENDYRMHVNFVLKTARDNVHYYYYYYFVRQLNFYVTLIGRFAKLKFDYHRERGKRK